MSTIDYSYHQERTADAIQQYRGHTERDFEDLQLLRKQTALQASLIWEQQMLICKMNEAYLQLSDEKELIDPADNRLVHECMEHISTMMTSLQQSLLERHEVLAATMDPIDSACCNHLTYISINPMCIKEDIHMYFKMYINSTSCNYEMYHICTLKVSEMYIVVY